MPAKSGDTVTVHYTGTLDDGTVFDSSEGRAPLLFTIGSGDVIPGFESAVIGLEPGQKTTVTIDPENGYGPRHEGALQEVDVQVFGEAGPVVGGQYSFLADDGTNLAATVTGMNDELTIAYMDFNHPLAGRSLEFTIELVEIVGS